MGFYGQYEQRGLLIIGLNQDLFLKRAFPSACFHINRDRPRFAWFHLRPARGAHLNPSTGFYLVGEVALANILEDERMDKFLALGHFTDVKNGRINHSLGGRTGG
jgi:hypothetical protein